MAQAVVPLSAAHPSVWRLNGARRQPTPGGQRQQCRRQCAGWSPLRQQAASRQRAVAEDSTQDEIEGGYCMPAFVTADNNRSKCFTVLDVEVGDYPGLLRVLSWSLNGLDVVAQNAVVRTSEDGIAHNTFWLTCRGGEKLEDEEAELLAERVRDFVMYCSPDESASRKTEFCAGPIHISNRLHEQYTVLTVQEPQPTPGFLLEVASALSGMNVCIQQGVVHGVSCDAGDDLAMDQLDESQLDDSSCLLNVDDMDGRKFTFWLKDSQGRKMDYGGMTALVYTLSSVLGYRSHPTVPPDQEMLESAR
ncbi:hypothetical protein D9Q98_009665 [Chlorella vulgaris]|uniref:ACT domain-containing protein n=1 Tax=Chlorella vulgaris TaxID=3077 RepID=A0A9D4YS69_CHLVU|nr:hypothetical protein D9Q98_009665 [Chlorella vulgaris]